MFLKVLKENNQTNIYVDFIKNMRLLYQTLQNIKLYKIVQKYV